jgi:predicted PurR-regulated permease PerM
VTNTNPETTQDPGVGATNSPSGLLSTTNPPGSTNAVAAGQGSITTTNSTASILSNAIDRETLQSATGFITRYVPKVGSWLFGQVGRVASWFGVLAGLSLIPVYAFYLLLEKRGISSHWANYLPVSDSRFKDEMVFVIKSINDYLIAFFRGQVLVAICDGILYTIGFLIIGLPYAVLVGVMATFLTMIPFIGAILTCVAALIIMLVQHGDWQHPAMVMAVFAVVQALEGLVISPKIMGNKVQLHPVTIIISVMVGTTLLGGLLGGILAIPLTAALRVVMFRYVWKRPTAEAIEEARAAR